MMKHFKKLTAVHYSRPSWSRTIPASLLFMSLLTPATCLAGVQATYMYKLSNFQGPVESLWARLTVDPEEGEVYTLNQQDKAIQIFNTAAMQVYGFGEDLSLATATDISSGKGGDMYVLFSRPENHILQLDYKGDIVQKIVPGNIPAEFKRFRADYLDYRNDRFYLADAQAMQVIILSANGEYQEGHNFRQMVNARIEEQMQQPDISKAQQKSLEDSLKAMGNTAFGGFSTGNDGTIYFTAGTISAAFRYTPDGTLDQWGVPGGAPSKFGVVAGIQPDSQGNIFISDRLRCVVMMFDKDLNYVMEFGYRGDSPDSLIVPDDIAIDEQNHKLYVSQAANMGVSVFSLQFN